MRVNKVDVIIEWPLLDKILAIYKFKFGLDLVFIFILAVHDVRFQKTSLKLAQ